MDSLGGNKSDLRTRTVPLDSTTGFKILEAAIVKQTAPTLSRKKAEGITKVNDEILPKCLEKEVFKKYNVDSWYFNREANVLIDYFFENYDPEAFIATATAESTGKRNIKTPQGIINLKSYVPYYAIASIDSGNRNIVIEDPEDTSKPFELTFDQFKEKFRGLNAVRINHKQFLSQTENSN